MNRFIESIRPSAASLARAIGLLFLLLALDARAGNYCNNPVPPCDPSDPSSWCYRPTDPPATCEPLVCGKCTKSPCYVGSGVYTTEESDLVINTVGFPIAVSRLYQGSHVIDGESGHGWVSSLSARLYYAVYLKAEPNSFRGDDVEAHIRLPNGSIYRFVENLDGTYTPPAGRFDTLVRNADFTWDLRPQRTQSRLHFSATGNLLQVIDDFGNTAEWIYEDDRLVQIRNTVLAAPPEQRPLEIVHSIDIAWGADGRISSVTDFTGRTIHYQYDPAHGTLIGVTNPLGQTTEYEYDAGKYGPRLRRMADHWDRDVSLITYDSQDRVLTYTDQGELYRYTYAYNGNRYVTKKEDSVGNFWLYTFNGDGLVTESRPPATIPPTGPVLTQYDSHGLIVSKVDQVGVRTLTTYNARGNPSSVTYDASGPSAVRFDYAYDPNFPDKVVSITPYNPATNLIDPNWHGVRKDYYPPGSIAPGALHHVYEVRDDGTTARTMATYTYDARGRVLTMTDAGGNVTTNHYDNAGWLEQRTMPANNDSGVLPVTRFERDMLGRTLAMTDPAGHVTRYTWDVLDRMTSMTLPKPSASSSLSFVTSYFYDELDVQTQLLSMRIVGPNGRTGRFETDQYGRTVVRTGPAGEDIRWEYLGNRLAAEVDSNNNRTSYVYDALGRLATITYPDATFVQYTYLADSTVGAMRDRAGQTMSFSYDAFKRVKTRSYPDGKSVTNTYMGQKLTQVVDTLGASPETHTFAWDNTFRRLSATQAGRGTVSYSYRATDGALETRSVTGGATTTLDYYPDGSVRTVNWSPVAGSFTYAYGLDRHLQSLTFPNGQTRTYAYDDQGRPTQLTNWHPTAGELATFSYGYDVDPFTGLPAQLGHRTSVTATVPALGLAGAVSRFSFDDRSLMTRAAYPASAPYNGLSQQWTYDDEGNRTSETVGTTTSVYTYEHLAGNPLNGIRLVSDGSNTYSYGDGKGNVTARAGSRGAFTFGFDQHNLLRSVRGGISADFRYDYAGRRTSATVAGTSTTYLYDDVHAIAETSGASRTEYLFGPGYDHPLAMVRDGAVHYYAVDALGSVATVGNAAGAVENSYAWDAWGNGIAATETVTNPLGFTGRESSVAGLQFNRFRFYEPATGRFAGEDPKGFAGGLNTYLYGFANPSIYRDPLGLSGVQVCFFPEAVLGFGHMGFGTDRDNGGTESLSRATWPINPVDPGQVTPDTDPVRECILIDAPPVNEKCMERCRDERKANPTRYDINDSNCKHFVEGCLKQCGLLPRGPYLDSARPRPFWTTLKERVPQYSPVWPPPGWGPPDWWKN